MYNENKIYAVNRKYVYIDLENAINKSKEILLNRLIKPLNEPKFSIKRTEKGFSVKLEANYDYVGNSNLLFVSILMIKPLDK